LYKFQKGTTVSNSKNKIFFGEMMEKYDSSLFKIMEYDKIIQENNNKFI